MPILRHNRALKSFCLESPETPELYRDLFPYSSICRSTFDDMIIVPKPAEEMRITDTTFRDGQQARPPYSVKQIARIFDLMQKLGGKTGLIHATEFFMYSEKDRKAIEVCRSRGYRFPRITGWIRAHIDDLKIARDMEFDEVGMLTSVSDYHIFLKLGKNRETAMNDYLKLVAQALDWGIIPRCHFEDITRADIYGFCVPLAQRLMELAKQSAMPVKIRLCDTMGYGLPYPGAALPRSVQRIVHAFTTDAGVPSAWLEWHGHNDFHKSLVNGVTAWLSGCGAVNGSLLGFGERTGNTPLEALVVEYISLTGNDNAADTSVINQIGEYFETELDYRIPDNYPFVGKDFNATSAGVHVDGLAKNEEIYNIFDTTRLLGRPVPIIITDKSGRAGVAYWINNHLKLSDANAISKKHPAVGKIYDKIMEAYANGRNTSFSNKEMTTLVRRNMPELFTTEFEQMKTLAGNLSSHVLMRLAQDELLKNLSAGHQASLEKFVAEYPFIQYLYAVNVEGQLTSFAFSAPAYAKLYEGITLNHDYADREWFKVPMRTGELHIMDVYQSHHTKQLIITVSCAITDEKDNIIGVLGADIQLQELLRRADALKDEEPTDNEE